MANYINKEILCEAYTHLDIETHDSATAREQLEKELREFILPRAKFIFGQDVELQFEFEDGSLKTKIAILGAAVSLISAYGSFRQGADQITRDATVIAQASNLEVIFKTRAKTCDRIRIEKRAGIFGRVNHLLKTIEPIRDEAGHHQFPETHKELRHVSNNIDELNNWYSDADKLISKLDSDETKVCITAGLLEELAKFPEKFPWEEESKTDSFRAKMLNADPDLASRVDAAAARYSRLIKLIKDDFCRLIEKHSPQKA